MHLNNIRGIQVSLLPGAGCRLQQFGQNIPAETGQAIRALRLSRVIYVTEVVLVVSYVVPA